MHSHAVDGGQAKSTITKTHIPERISSIIHQILSIWLMSFPLQGGRPPTLVFNNGSFEIQWTKRAVLGVIGTPGN